MCNLLHKIEFLIQNFIL